MYVFVHYRITVDRLPCPHVAHVPLWRVKNVGSGKYAAAMHSQVALVSPARRMDRSAQYDRRKATSISISHHRKDTLTKDTSLTPHRTQTPHSPSANSLPRNEMPPTQHFNVDPATTYSSPNEHHPPERLIGRDSYPNINQEPPEEHTGAQIVSAAIEQNDQSNDLPFYIGMDDCQYWYCFK